MVLDKHAMTNLLSSSPRLCDEREDQAYGNRHPVSPVDVTHFHRSSSLSQLEECFTTKACVTGNNSNNINATRSRNSRKSVRFSPFDEVDVISSELSAKERAQIWYSEKECAEIRSEYVCTLILWQTGKLSRSPSDVHTTRGLEDKTRQGKWLKGKARKESVKAVLEQQQLNRLVPGDGSCDDDWIARIYAEKSADEVFAARQRALVDEKQAATIHGESRAAAQLSSSPPLLPVAPSDLMRKKRKVSVCHPSLPHHQQWQQYQHQKLLSLPPPSPLSL